LDYSKGTRLILIDLNRGWGWGVACKAYSSSLESWEPPQVLLEDRGENEENLCKKI